ncbi:MAG: bifunctional folylpolyglutamate synthase/dihydrofolate synthase [Flavobacteriales bacterium]|nr:bifunctional folylpolyglutamate synthase/dihydrofolate synthase [Flavobacteriales bacterium]
MRLKTYQQCEQWLIGHLPMFQRIGAPAYKKDLTNIRALCAALDNPHLKFPSVHVAGTNGKGSVCHMLASVLQEAGYCTGLTTSPHLTSYRERIRINGTPISEEAVVDFVRFIQPLADQIHPSFFEISIAMAFWYFQKNQVDVAVVETGMGGRLDSTNVLSPLLAVITNIGLDHMEFLGCTHSAIAAEKAGIIKPHTPVVVGAWRADTWPVFEAACARAHSSLIPAFHLYKAEFADDEVLIWKADTLWTRTKAALKGNYQLENYATVAAAVDVLREKGFQLSPQAVAAGLSKVVENTGLRGRWQVLSWHPFVVLDTGHNPDGYAYVAAQFNSLSHKDKWVLLGFTREKNPVDFVKFLSPSTKIVFSPMSVPRSQSEQQLLNCVREAGLKAEVVPDVSTAWNYVKPSLTPESALLVGGSTFLVADFLKIWENQL